MELSQVIQLYCGFIYSAVSSVLFLKKPFYEEQVIKLKIKSVAKKPRIYNLVTVPLTYKALYICRWTTFEIAHALKQIDLLI